MELAPMPKYKSGTRSCSYHIMKIIEAYGPCPKSKIYKMMPAESLIDNFTKGQIDKSLYALYYNGKLVKEGSRYRRATLSEFESREQELKGAPKKSTTFQVIETQKVVEHGIHFARGAAVAGFALLVGLAVGVFL